MARPAKGHTGRQRKLECPDCGFIAYASGTAITSAGVPTCACGEPMVVANVRDLLALGMVDVSEIDTPTLRKLGYADVTRAKAPPSHKPWARCTFEGCNRRRARSESFCSEHVNCIIPF